MDAASGKCAPCKTTTGEMNDCLAVVCTGMPGILPLSSDPVALATAVYGSSQEQSWHGANSPPDPYPPRPIILP